MRAKGGCERQTEQPVCVRSTGRELGILWPQKDTASGPQGQGKAAGWEGEGGSVGPSVESGMWEPREVNHGPQTPHQVRGKWKPPFKSRGLAVPLYHTASLERMRVNRPKVRPHGHNRSTCSDDGGHKRGWEWGWGEPASQKRALSSPVPTLGLRPRPFRWWQVSDLRLVGVHDDTVRVTPAEGLVPRNPWEWRSTPCSPSSDFLSLVLWRLGRGRNLLSLILPVYLLMRRFGPFVSKCDASPNCFLQNDGLTLLVDMVDIFWSPLLSKGLPLKVTYFVISTMQFRTLRGLENLSVTLLTPSLHWGLSEAPL